MLDARRTDGITTLRTRLPKDRIFQAYGYSPLTPEVAAFHNSEARTRITVSPARTSKSYSAAHEAIYHCFPDFERDDEGGVRWLPEPTGDRRIWLIGPAYNTLKEWDYVWDAMVARRRYNPLGQLYRVVARANSVNQGSLRIVMEFGDAARQEPVRVVVEGKSATSPESLQGEQVHLALLSEAAEHDEKILARYLGTRCRYVLLPTTPKNSAVWLKTLQEEGAAHSELGIESFRFTPSANPHYDWDGYWIEHAKAEGRVLGEIVTEARGHDCFDNLAACAANRDPSFAEQFQGEWTGAAERLLPFRQETHTTPGIPSWTTDCRIFVSCDYGYNDAAVALWWAIHPSDESLLIFNEIYERELPAHRFVAAIHERSRALGVRPDYYVGDPKQPQIAAVMRERGLPVWDRHKKAMADRAAGGHALVDALSPQPGTGVPRLTVSSACPATIREWERLSRKPGTSVKEWSPGALLGDDHAFDAARYGIMSRPRPTADRQSNEMQRYLAALRQRSFRQPSLPAVRLVGGAPRTTTIPLPVEAA